MEEKKFRDMIDSNTKSNYDIENILSEIKKDEKYLDIKPSEVKWGGLENIGDYSVVMYRSEVLVYNKERVFAIISVYEINSFDIIPEKDLVAVYGREDVVLYFLDGFITTISTKG